MKNKTVKYIFVYIRIYGSFNSLTAKTKSDKVNGKHSLQPIVPPKIWFWVKPDQLDDENGLYMP